MLHHKFLYISITKQKFQGKDNILTRKIAEKSMLIEKTQEYYGEKITMMKRKEIDQK